MIPRCVRTVARFARTASLAAAALVFSASMLAAQATGKIEGRVRDNAGAPIANAQVFLVGTAFSALTNGQGYFFINNVPVGTADMRAAFVGYRPVVARGVLIRGGQTSTQDFALQASVVELEAINITAEKPLVPRDQVTSKPIVSGEMTDQLPADRINAVLALQPGVVASSGSGSLSIRGGRGDENITYVDGVPVQSGNRSGAFNGVSAGGLTVATNGFQEATITTGASAAEFGNAQAGVISLETKTGGQAFRGNIGFETDEFAGVTNNNSVGFNRFQVGFGGPIGVVRNLTFSVNGALEGQRSIGTGKDPESPLYAPVGVDTVMAVPNSETLVDTSYVPVATFAVYRGNCDEIESNNPDIKDNYGVECQGVRFQRSAASNYALGGKVNYTFGAGNRVTFSSNMSQNQGRNFAYTTQLNPAQTTGFRNVNNVYTASGNFNLNRSAERALAVEAYLSYQTDQTLGGPLTSQSEVDTRDPFMGFLITPIDFRFNFDNFALDSLLLDNYRNNTPGSRRTPYDIENTSQYAVVDQYRNNPYGVLGWSESGGPTGRLNMYRENRLVGRVGLDWQADRFNRVKVGGDYTRYDMNYYSHTLTSQAFSDVFHEKPTRYSGFVSDRLDLGDVVVDLGLRYDWYTEQFERAGRPPALAQRRALEHHGSGIGPRHVDACGIRRRIDPRALGWPAEPGRGLGRPPLHHDHAVIDVEVEVADEPMAHFAQGQAVAHDHRPRPDEALPAGAQEIALNRAARRIGSIEHPHRFAMFGRGLEHVKERGDEGVDTAANVLEVDQYHIERTHRLAGRAADLAVEAEHRHLVGRVGVVGRFHHIVLEVATDAMLRPEHRRNIDSRRDQGIEAVGKVAGDRGRMREQGDALAFERRAERGIGEQAVDSEQGHRPVTSRAGR